MNLTALFLLANVVFDLWILFDLQLNLIMSLPGELGNAAGSSSVLPRAIPGSFSGILYESEDVFSIKADCLNGQEMDSKLIFFYFSRCHRLPSDGETIQLFESTPTFMVTFRALGPIFFCTVFSPGGRRHTHNCFPVPKPWVLTAVLVLSVESPVHTHVLLGSSCWLCGVLEPSHDPGLR